MSDADRRSLASPAAADYFSTAYTDYCKQNPERKLDLYMSLVKSRLEKGARLFELGTGKGLFLARAVQQFECTACDVHPVAVASAAQAAPDATVLSGSYELLQQKPASYDAIVSWDVLEHIPQLDEALVAVRTALRPEGIFAGVVPVYDGPLGWLVHLLDRDPTHVHKLGRQEWPDHLRQAGFRLLETGGVLRGMVLGHYCHLARPQFLLRRCGVGFYFVAAKS